MWPSVRCDQSVSRISKGPRGPSLGESGQYLSHNSCAVEPYPKHPQSEPSQIIEALAGPAGSTQAAINMAVAPTATVPQAVVSAEFSLVHFGTQQLLRLMFIDCGASVINETGVGMWYVLNHWKDNYVPINDNQFG